MVTRRERIVLDVEDNATPAFARAAGAAKLLDKSLNDLSGHAVRAGRDLDAPAHGADNLGNSSRRADSSINQLTGRLRLLTDAALILGPAVSPLGGLALGGLVTFTAQLGATAAAFGVTLLAVQGLSDGLKALDAYQLEPTAENLAKLNEELVKLGPSGANFVRFLDSIEGELESLQQAARDGALPGFQESIESMLQRLPELRALISGFATEVGDLAADAGEAFASDKLNTFLDYLRTDGVPILDDTARTVGNLTLAGLNLLAAFSPLQRDFSGGLLDFSRNLADASQNLDENPGFQELLSYIEETGPQALATLGALANAMLQIVEATAPLGGPVLQALEGVAKAIALIADSDLGTPIFAALAALALYNRALTVTATLNKTAWGGAAIGSLKDFRGALTTVITAQDRARMSAQQLAAVEAQRSAAYRSGFATIGKGTAVLGALALANSGLAEKTGLSNTASMALMGTLGGPWGVAIGAGIGLTQDFAAANDDLEHSLQAMNAAAGSGDLNVFANSIGTAQAKLDAFTSSPSWTDALTGFGLIGFAKNKDSFSAMWSNLTGGSDDAQAKIDAARKQLEGLRNGSIQTFNPVRSLGDAIQGTAQAALDEAQALRDATDAMRAKRQEALRGVNATLDYNEAILNANKGLAENGKDFSKNTEAGIANRRLVYGLADAWNAQSNAAKNAKGSLESARHNFIETATQLGATAAEAHKLANQLFEIPPKRKTQIELDGADQAISKAQTLKQVLDQLHSKDINIALHYQTIGNKPHVPAPGTSADGSTIPGPRYPYADKMLYLLAPGEEVISNRYGQADRHRDLLKAINDGRLADGGTAGSARRGGGDVDNAVTILVPGIYSAAAALKAWKAELDKQTKAFDRAKQARDAAVSRRDSLSSTIQQNLMGDSIWAGSSGSVWAAGAMGANSPQGAIAALNARKDRANRFIAALNTLRSKGVTGAALQEILSEGLEATEAMAAADIGTLSTFATAFNESNQALAAAGLAGGNAVEGDNIRDTNRELRGIRHDLHEVKQAIKEAEKANDKAHDKNAEKVTAGVNGAASHGHRRGR